MRIKHIMVTIAVWFTVVGCVTSPDRFNANRVNKSIDENDYALVSKNLVSVMAQLEHTKPLTTTFQMSIPSTPFGNAVFKEIEAQGYGIQLVSGDLGNTFLRYKAEISQSESGYKNSYSLDVSGTSIEREYITEGRHIMPSSAVTVKGTHADDLVLDDGLFEYPPDANISHVVIIEDETPEIIFYASSNTEPTIQTQASDLRNVFDMKQSNFKSVFAKYNDVEKQILVFGNDSLVLGPQNKNKIRSLSSRINPDTDIVSVIGCSHGRTSIENGNQILAEGRTQRVKESLLYSGVSAEIILDEACWASKYWDEEAPRRGVMVTHKRKSR